MKNWKSCLAAALALAAATAFSAEPLRLQWGTIDTSSPAARTESAALKAKVAKKAARARKYTAPEARAAYIVQFPGPVTEEWRAWLESATQVRGYLPEFAYLVWATATEMEAIAANPDVFWTGEWKKEYKTVRAGSARAAKSAASATAAATARWMHIGSLLAGDAGAADLRARLEALPADVRSAFPRIGGVSAVVFLTDAQIDAVASWPDVEWIEPQLKPRLFNDKAALPNMMNVAPAWEAVSDGGLGLTGAGQVVAVADTGCDTGSTNDIHADFAGRVKYAWGWTNGKYTASASWADTSGHGTHVCGSVLGSGAASTNLYRGMAWEAELVVQGCGADLDGIPDDPLVMLKQAHLVGGACIHSDSWGYGPEQAGQYTATEIDDEGVLHYLYASMYVDGYMWTNQNFIMVIAAGNNGVDTNADGVVDPGSVIPPGTAKNCICVGAAENYRSFTNTWGAAAPDLYPADPIKSGPMSRTDTPQGIAAFSGRGSTLDGRWKPDIVAPGTHVISVRSRATASTGWGVVDSNTNYIYEGGTSMATPLTAGALALVRQWLVERRGIANPPAALMKALLINGARDMTPGQYGTGAAQEITARPDRSQGFGHVNLYNTLDPGDGRFLHFATNRIPSTGAAFTTNFTVGQPNAGPYILTLAWQDYPGDVGAEKTLVNDLDLTVTSPSGTVHYPNNLSTNDRLNNVEFIEFAAPETGPWTVTVHGWNVPETRPHGGQPFALVVRGPVTSLAPVFTTPATNAAVTLGETLTFRFDSLLSAGYPDPTYELVAPSAPCDTFDPATGELHFAPDAPGTYTFTCTASNANGTATCTLAVTATVPFPGVPAGVAFTDVATDAFTVTWSNVPYADTYRIDVLEGNSFDPFAAPPVLEEHFDTRDIPSGWDIYTGVGSSPTRGYYRAFVRPNQYVVTSDFGSGDALEFWTYYHGPDSRFIVSGLVARVTATGGMANDWNFIADVPLAEGNHTNKVVLPSGTSRVGLYLPEHTGDCNLDDIIVHGPPDCLPGWTDAPVDAPAATVTGLRQATAYAVRVRAVNDTGTSGNSLDATVTTHTNSAFLAWLDIHDAPGHSPYETAPNAHTYWDNYIADIDPTNTTFLDLTVTDPATGRFTVTPVSTDRWYQLLYTTNLAQAFTNTTPLGWGATNTPFPVEGDWYGGIRVLLDAPTAP